MTKRRPNIARAGVATEVVLTLVALLVFGGVYARRHPYQLPPRPDEQRVAPARTGDPSADVLVVLPTVAEAHSLDQWCTDQAWLNVVEREIGAFRVVDTGALTRSSLDPSAWAIIPKRAASQLDPTQTQFIRNWVEDGGTVVIEQPEGPWRGLAGQQFSNARTRETRRITSFDGALSRGELRADILEMPLRTSLAPFNPPELSRGRDYQVLLEVDGQPGVVSLAIGRGHVLLLLFDFGRAVATTTQGLPAADFTVTPTTPGDGELAFTADLAVDDAMAVTHIPFVDLLERNLLYLLDVHRPIGRLWYFPSTHRGALLVSHSEAWSGPAAGYMTDWEHGAEVDGTFFAVATSLPPETLARLARTAADVQLQWVPAGHPRVPARTWGLRSFEPVARPMSMLEQFDSLNRDTIPYGPAIAARSLDATWPRDYFAGFRTLEAASIQIDSSFGPPPAWLDSRDDRFGYLFGTGQPFRPLDQSGDRFKLRELPITVDATARGYSLARVRQVIVDAAEGYHTAIAAEWRPDVMVTRPSFDAIEGWQQAFSLAESQDLWVTTYNDYADFLARRDTSHVESRFSREERRLTIEAKLVGPDAQSEGQPTDASELTPSVAFPARFEGRPVDRLIVDNESTPTAALALTGDRVLHVLPLPPGDHRVQVIYGSPLDSETPTSAAPE
ncbi:MAG: hypothetical protein H6698_04755 [Myxococcales bacterium]|nr:hypothetical protein [Myxococcales bacterium]MCB9533612.1 hypothetical protein [Myxococcales bacterium]